jgi:hypothetical protein
VYSVANIIVIVGNNRDSTLRGCFGWGGRKLYVAGKYMAELIGLLIQHGTKQQREN